MYSWGSARGWSRSGKRTQQMKEVDELDKWKSKYSTKVKDVAVTPEYDVNTITPVTLENLMKFLDLVPYEKAKMINMKFHER